MEFLQTIAPYRGFFLVGFELLMLYAIVVVCIELYKEYKEKQKASELNGDKYAIGNQLKGRVSLVERQNFIRQVLCMDGVDASPNTYMTISDGGKEVYVRTVTISAMPSRVVYAETIKELMEFPNSVSSAFVKPEEAEVISRKIDKQINELESEIIGAEGNTNRVRKLDSQVQETTKWAYEVESGNKSFFHVGFLFTFTADSLEQLNRITDDFRGLARKKKIRISNCFGCQSEAYLANMGLNRMGQKRFSNILSDCVKMFLVDQSALSIILHYTSDHFSHKSGIPLGRNLFNGQPFIFDMYDPSHFGYTLVIAGKTFSGKSATIKMMIERYVPLGYRFVIIDSQARKGTSEGEYTSSALLNGGVTYQISNKSENILNPFDVQESIEFVKESNSSGYEKRTLDLNAAITDVVYILRILIRGNMENKTSGDTNFDLVMDSSINDILTTAVKELYDELGIEHGNADSLYEEGNFIKDGMLQSGDIPKELPTLSDLYLKLVVMRTRNREEDLEKVYRFILSNLRENVRELYFTEEGDSFTREEFEELPVNPENPTERLYEGLAVRSVKGIRPYYDGQSTFAISRDYPVTTIDISQLKSESERRPARNIALHLVDGGFVKKNSERLDKADKLVVVIDEAHESFIDPSARVLLANEVRTARKLNVGLIFSTQTVAEYSRHDETKDILEQAAAKMVFKQDVADLEELTKALKITDSQANIIRSRLGVVVNKDDPEERSRHRGEVCVIDGEQVVFVKVDYLRKTEGLSVETDASGVIQARKLAK